MSRPNIVELRIPKFLHRQNDDGTDFIVLPPPILSAQIEFYRKHQEVVVISETPTLVVFRMPRSVQEECHKEMGIQLVQAPSNDNRMSSDRA